MSKIDIWSSRIANFSQIGVLALAAFGYFYTVLPVYQKSLLDEEIAKKTLELESKDKKIEEFNKLLSVRSSELKKLTEDAEKARADASSAQSSLKIIQGKYTKQYSELRIHLLMQFISLATSSCRKAEWNSIQLTQCLYKASNSQDLEELSKADKTKLLRSINSEIPKMVKSYNDYISNYRSNISKNNQKIDEIKRDCENQKAQSSYKDKIKKIEVDYDCIKKVGEVTSQQNIIEVKKIFAIQEMMDKSLNFIAAKAAN